MDIRTLQYIVTLAEELHFGRAAQRHFISAQPFGQHVQRLEREVGTRLFERSSRRVTMTPAGARFVDGARDVLHQLDRLRDVAAEEDLPLEDRHLRVGVLGFGAGDRWGDLRDIVRRQLPDLRLEHLDLTFAEQYDAVRTGEVDVALVQYVGEIDGLQFERILSSPRVVVVPVESPYVDAHLLTAAELVDAPWLSLAGPEPALVSWSGRGPAPGAPEVRHPAAISSAVATTGHLSLHAAAAARFFPHPDVRFVPVEGPPVQVAVATRAGDRSAGASAFRRAGASIGSLATI
jgi:DNA-binding transcriptional LysR family regulator